MKTGPRSVMLFAAGFGTRMGMLTADRAKSMIEVAGRPLIDHALSEVEEFGANRIVVNLHYRAEQLKAHLAGRNVLFSHESPSILETGGGLRHALPLLGKDPVFTMNTDAVWSGPNPLSCLAENWCPEIMDALLLCVPPGQAHAHKAPGDFLIDPAGRASRGAGLVYSGVQILKTDGLNDIPDAQFSLNLLWDKMLTEGRLFAVPYAGHWCDVGHPEAMPIAEEMLGYKDV